MSKNINVNPDHYKVAGRERQGENVIHRLEKREVTRLRRQERTRGASPAKPKTKKPETLKPKTPKLSSMTRPSAGISNRESPAREARDRREHPPVDTSSPPPEDAAGRVGEQPLDDRRDRHTSHKAGSRSIAQKEAGSRYPDRSMPASRKVAGAFGREQRKRSV